MYVEILMATYNGSKYLKDQIDSILNQDYSQFKLIIRDDCSNDTTSHILKEYQEKYPNKISILEGSERVGVKGNFSKLLESSKADYIMLADQDDVWLANKIKLSLEKIREVEKKYGQSTPILIHTNLKVVNEKLELISESFWNYTNIFPSNSKTINKILVQNVVTGCTVILNKSLKEIALPIPPESFMHDWWLALVASLFGKIDIIDQSTMLYRQHNKNTLGALKYSSLNWFKQALQKVLKKSPQKREQAKVMLSRYREKLMTKEINLLNEYINLPNESFIKKRQIVIKNKFFKNGILRNFAEILFPS